MSTKQQMAFVFRQENCVGCEACTVACQVGRDLSEGLKYREVTEHQRVSAQGRNVAVFLSQSCHHCASAPCVELCPTGAMTKRDSDGIVYIQQDLCISCGKCIEACPYDAPRIDPETNLMTKCDMCKDLLDVGQQAYCVTGCPCNVLSIMPREEALMLEGATSEGIGFTNLTAVSTVFIKRRV